MIELSFFRKKLVKTTKVTEKLILSCLRSKKPFWMDMTGYHPKEIELLRRIFKIHHLTIEDCTHGGTRPKVDQFLHHDYLVFYSIKGNHRSTITLPQLNFFIGKNFLISLHKENLPSTDQLKRDEGLCKELLPKGPDYLLHYIIDVEVDHYFVVLEKFEQELDRLQDHVLEDSRPGSLQKLFHIKKQITQLKRLLTPERNLISTLMQPQIRYISDAMDLYFRDVEEHLIHFDDRIDTDRDIITTVIDLHVSVTSNKLNEIMKVLTVIATIMLPLTVIVGIYGMNFKYMPELGWKYGYFGVLTIMALVAIFMLSWFKRRKWIGV